MAADKRITVFGGSGFIGRYLIRRLAADGWVVRIAVRDPVPAATLKPAGNVGQIVPMRCNILDDAAVAAAVSGANAVVNLVGILSEWGRNRFDAVQAEAPARIGRAAAAAGVARVIHVSAVGASTEAESRYAKTKGEGEAGLRAAFPAATILRPSLVIGPEDNFFNRFGTMMRFTPALPLIGGGKTRFQPVYVADVADAIMRTLAMPASAGKTYELGGPRVYTFRELMELLLKITGRKRALVSLPFGFIDMQAAVLQYLPVPPITRDQVKQLESDNVCAPGALGFADLGMQPQSIEAILPTYLDVYRRGGRFAGTRAA
jgi:uncharacterized protein YbjT (DUF2867 family)